VDKFSCWAVVSGYSSVVHKRASNVWKNLERESVGIKLNEYFWEKTLTHPYVKQYDECRRSWEELIKNEQA